MVPSKVCSVTPALLPSAERNRRIVERLERAFGNQAQTVDQGVASHWGIVPLAGIRDQGSGIRDWDQVGRPIDFAKALLRLDTEAVS